MTCYINDCTPSEIREQIFSYLPWKEQIADERVCKLWEEECDPLAKKQIWENFNDEVDRTSQLFQKMTSRKVQEFLISPPKDASAKQLAEHINAISVEMFASVCPFSGSYTVDKEEPHFRKLYKDAKWEKDIFILVDFFKDSIWKRWNSWCAEPSYPQLKRFPAQLFDLEKQGETTAFPVKGKLWTITVKPPGHWRTYEAAFKVAVGNPQHLRSLLVPENFYIWQGLAGVETSFS